MNGGQAIENAAKKATNLTKFPYEAILTKRRDCQFSFAGLWGKSLSYINEQERELNIDGSTIIPDVYNLCAALQTCLVKHICLRTQRAMEFIDKLNLMSREKRTLVLKFL